MTERIYATARWKRLRAAKLREQPLCEQCTADGITTPAVAVDHVQAISDGGDPFPPLSNLRALCVACHSAKTARGPEAGAVKTNRQRIRKGCDASGRSLDPNHPWTAKKSLGAKGVNTAPYVFAQLVSGVSHG